MMLIEDIEEHPDFKALYKIDAGVLERIVKSMKESGFDESQPVHIWLTEDGHKYLIDGYTRYTARRRQELLVFRFTSITSRLLMRLTSMFLVFR